MERKSHIRDEVPPEALACIVKGHAHLRYPLPDGNWLVAAVPSGRQLVHARSALAAFDPDTMMDALEAPNEVRQSALGLREDVKLFRVEVAGPVPAMSEAEADAAKIQFAPPIGPDTGNVESEEAGPEAPWPESFTAGGEDADDALDQSDLPGE